MKTPATRFEDLVVWQKAHQFVLAAYRLSRTFPDLKPMVCRLNFDALPSPLPRTLRKGFKKRGKADKLRFYRIAQGSVEESRYYLILARNLEYGDVSELSQLLEEVSKLLEAYSQAILDSDC